MLVITAAVPAERGALVIKALQKVVDARTDETGGTLSIAAGGGWRFRCRDGGCGTGGRTRPVRTCPQRGDERFARMSRRTWRGHTRTALGSWNRWRRPTVRTTFPQETQAPPADDPRSPSNETGDLPDSLLFELSSPGQRFADALVDVAEHYLASGPVPLEAAPHRPALRGRPHHRSQRTDQAVDAGPSSFPCRPGLGHRRGGRPPHRLRCRPHRVHPGCAGQRAELRTAPADRSGAPVAGTEAARPQPLPLSRLSAPTLRRGASRPALDRRRRDAPRESGVAVQCASPAAASRRLPHHRRGRRCPLHRPGRRGDRTGAAASVFREFQQVFPRRRQDGSAPTTEGTSTLQRAKGGCPQRSRC